LSDPINDYSIPLIALIGTVFGGAGLEFIKRWLSKAKDRTDIATELRAELRQDLNNLKKEMDAMEDQLIEWKDKYYDMLLQKMELRVELETLRSKYEGPGR
jgi:septal ring factor EnvC (AmiA/AmiB activator)